jgi:glycosyltransferase involved in cell wall biosynthesis
MTSILYAGNKLSRHGYTPGIIETLGPLLEAEGYMVFYAGTKKNQVLRLAEMLFITMTRGRKADYILIDTYSTSAFWYAYLICRLACLFDKKYIPILHGGNLPARLLKSKKACDRLFLRSYANVAVSGYLKHEFDKAGYKTVVIPNSIDISKYPFRLRDHTRPRLLWVRSFHRQYNPNMAAEVLSQLLKVYPDALLCMVGPDKDGSLEDFRHYIRQKSIEDHVKITGRLSKEEWIRLSEDYDFFFNTTNIDNTPVSVVEAMALGLIVVSTNPGGIPYLLEANKDAKIVNIGDAAAMSREIRYLIEDPSVAREMTRTARMKAESFDSKRVIKLWTKLLT